MTEFHAIEFERTENGIVQMAQYIAELVRQGIVYRVTTLTETFIVHTTGGF